MVRIKIEKDLPASVPGTALGTLHYVMHVEESPAPLLEKFDGCIRDIEGSVRISDIARMPHIASTRRAYKALGKDFHTYRNSAEAMLRRIAGGKGLYRINNAIDINNLISVLSGYSLGSYDVSGIKGDAVLRRAPEGTHYKGIGKDLYNIGSLPALYDACGPFGNPSSDSERTMVVPGRREILFVIYSFDGAGELRGWLDKTAALLETYGNEYECLGAGIVAG